MNTIRLMLAAACALAPGLSASAQSHEGHAGHAALLASAASGPSVRLLQPQPDPGDVALVDQDGRATTLREALASDKPVLVNFIFTSCTTICPVMSSGFAQFLANLGPGQQDEVNVVSISIDPEVDTPATLRAYAARYRAPRSWRFLTGSAPAIEAAQRAFGSYRGGRFNHAPGTFVRASRDAAWIALDGFASAEVLLHASMGHLAPPRR